MKTLNLKAFALGGLVVLASCQKFEQQDEPSLTDVENFKDIEAPEGFDFNTFKEINFNFRIVNSNSVQPSSIEIYDNRPTAGGELIYKGIATDGIVDIDLELPSDLAQVYVVKRDASGASTMQSLIVDANTVTHAFGKNRIFNKSSVTSPDCNTGCDQTITGGNWINLNNSDTYCLTGDVKGINDNDGNAQIRVCGNVELKNFLTIKGNTELHVTSNSTLSVKGINMNNHSGNSGKIVVYPNATLNITGNSFSAKGVVINHGTINLDKEIYFYGPFTNNGTMNVDGKGHSSSNSPGPLENNGSLTIDGHFTQNSNNTIKNNCYLRIKKQFGINSQVDNYAYIKADHHFSSNSGSAITYYNGAMLYVEGNADWLNGDMNGSGTTSLFKVDGNLSTNSAAVFDGNLEVCAGGNSNNLNASTISGNAVLACDQVYIPSSSCNPEGNGTPSVSDSDNDGVADANDDFPNDPNRASRSFYPSANTFATLAFEDLWPAQGDYDFNDLVMEYRFTYITNADNKVVELDVDYSVRAIGAGYQNGFGLQLDIAPGAVQSVSRTTNVGTLTNLNSNGTEAGQSKAVVIFFENAYHELRNPNTPGVNTTPGLTYSEPDTSNVNIVFGTAQDISALGSAPYNPFLFINEIRGREVHLSGQEPTDLADNSYFGNSRDDSDPATGRYYVTKDNLPWVINIPTSFKYPTEKTDMIKAYPYFDNWALSGGTSFTDWYADLPGYRDANMIY